MTGQPNVLIIHTDQQSRWTLGAYGGTLIDTPHIDSLADDGVRFDNFFVNSAVCTPSRGCMLTGRYPHCHGAYRNPVHINRDEITLAHILARKGYRTAYMGKWHLDGESRPASEWIPRDRAMGFDDSRYMLNRGHFKSVLDTPDGTISLSSDPDEGRYMTDWLFDKAIAEITRPPDARPFFLMVSIPDPHEPYCVRPPYSTRFQPDQMPLPESFQDDHPHPSWVRQAPVGAGSLWDRPDRNAHLRQAKASYCGEVKCIDDGVGRLLAALETSGLDDNTIVIYTTDHGDYMGEHGLLGKNMVYETAYRIPLLVRWPERLRPGTVVDRFVTTVDFQPTLLGLLDLPGSEREQGRDASAFLRGKTAEWTDEAFLHHSRFGYAGIFTPEFELGLARGGEHVLFDRRRDPDQLHNLVDRPEYRDTLSSLAARIVRHNTDLDSPVMEWLGDWIHKGRSQPTDDGPVVAVDWYNRRAGQYAPLR